MCYHPKYYFFMIILLFFMLYENDAVKKKKSYKSHGNGHDEVSCSFVVKFIIKLILIHSTLL